MGFSQNAHGRLIAAGIKQRNRARKANEMAEPTTQELAIEFARAFNCVFDQDWDHSIGCFKSPELYDMEDSFINNTSDDEGNNWACRAWLLNSYRAFVKRLNENGVDICEPDEPYEN